MTEDPIRGSYSRSFRRGTARRVYRSEVRLVLSCNSVDRLEYGKLGNRRKSSLREGGLRTDGVLHNKVPVLNHIASAGQWSKQQHQQTAEGFPRLFPFHLFHRWLAGYGER